MFGNIEHTIHPKKDTLLSGIKGSVEYPKKLQNAGVLKQRQTLVTPRFGGRSILLWVKGKTRAWIDRQNVFVCSSVIPEYFQQGSLLSAELFKNDENQWVVAFEDILHYKGSPFRKLFIDRYPVLCRFVGDLCKGADVSRDPGIFCVKPWSPCQDIVSFFQDTQWTKTPEWALFWTFQSGKEETLFCKLQKSHSQSMVYSLYRIVDDNPDQYDLIDESGKSVGKACVRTMKLSKWLATLEDGTKVRCRNVKGMEHLEPYELVRLF